MGKTEENIEANIDNTKVSSWKSKILPKDILIILVVAFLSALAYCITPTTSLAPGIQYRLFAFITPTLGIIMGKYRGGKRKPKLDTLVVHLGRNFPIHPRHLFHVFCHLSDVIIYV